MEHIFKNTNIPIGIITHDGNCHADDTACIALLQMKFNVVGIQRALRVNEL